MHYLRDTSGTLLYKSPWSRIHAVFKETQAYAQRRDKGRKDYGSKERSPKEQRRGLKRGCRISSRYMNQSVGRTARGLSSVSGERRGCSPRSLKENGVDWNNNAAKKEIRQSFVMRKITSGNQSANGVNAHKLLMSVRKTCSLKKMSEFLPTLNYLNPSSKRLNGYDFQCLREAPARSRD